jgi:hypothetical protein
MSNLLKELSTYKVKTASATVSKYDDLLESIEDMFEKFSFSGKDSLTEGKLTMAKIHTVVLSPGDGGIELKDKVFGIRNEDPIVAFMLQAMGVPMDGSAIRIRSGFMQYDQRSKMLFIAKFKSDLPNNRSNQETTKDE